MPAGRILQVDPMTAGESSLVTLEAYLTMPVADVEFEISEISLGQVRLYIETANYKGNESNRLVLIM